MESPDFKPLFRLAKWFVALSVVVSLVAITGCVLAVIWLFQHVRFF